MSGKWRSVDHVADVSRYAGEGLSGPVAAPAGVHRQARHHGVRPYATKVGDRYGELVVERLLHVDHLGRVWLLRCDCGGEAIRRSVALNRAARQGVRPACEECRRQLTIGMRETRRSALTEAFRKQWVDRRTLWTGSQTLSLQRQIKEDLEREFGDELDQEEQEACLRVRRFGYIEYAAGYPYSAHEHIEAARNMDRWHDVLPDGWSFPGAADASDQWHEEAVPLTEDELAGLASLEECSP